MSAPELYINGTLADTKGVKIELTLAIATIKNPSTRGGTGSLTVYLPGTKTNNRLLTNIYDIANDIQTSGIVNFAPDFNPNLKANIVVLCDGLTVLRGYMKLLQINRNQQDLRHIEYEVQLIGEVSNLFADIGEDYLTDLSFSEYNHTYNKATQEATWTATNYGDGYVYPMINYGNVAASSSWDVENFYPAIYAKTYVDKIFLAAGWTYTSTFLTSSFFKRLIIPFTRERLSLTSAQIAARMFTANTSAVTSGSVTMTGTESNIAYNNRPFVFNNEVSDPGGQYNPATGVFTCTVAGTYTFFSSGVVTADATTAVTFGGFQTANVSTAFQKNAVTFSSTSSNISTLNSYSAGQSIFARVFSHTAGVALQVGDTVEIDVTTNITVNMGSGSGTVTFSVLTGALFKNTISITDISDGNALDMSMAIPEEVKQKDFLLSIIRMFNLHCEVDKNVPNNILIETAEDFYNAGNTYDWTQKLAVDKGFDTTPMGALDANRYRFTYTEDGDYWNKNYKDRFNELYGEKRVDVVNDFLKNTNTTDVIFAPTPLIGSNTHDRRIPEIYTVDSSGNKQQKRSKIRLLYWAGATATADTWTYTSDVSGNSSETTYPYAGHLDDPTTPTLDLNFGVPKLVYYDSPTSGTISYTNNNIYNAYHSKFITEITNRNSKIVTGWFYLKPFDISRLSFRDRIFIDGHYFRIQRIIEFNANGGGLTKVELLKIKEGTPFTPSSGLIFLNGVVVNENTYIPDTRQ